jgi:hypothetical protein
VTRVAHALLREEVLELLAERPDLVAIADAFSATQASPRRRRRVSVRIGAAVALGVVAVASASLWPGSTTSDFSERANAAVGSGPVLHVVVDAPARTTIVDLASGEEVALRVRLEYRYDAERGLLRTTVSRAGRVGADVLQTPTVTHGDSRPELDPALVGFVSGYREALTTTKPVAGVVDGRRVLWLEFGSGPSRERVALDRQTLTPLFVESLVEPRVRWDVLEIRAREHRPHDFDPLAGRGPQPIRGSVVTSRAIALSELARSVPWLAVSDGSRIEGLDLTAVEVEQLVRGYAHPVGRTERGRGARLLYQDSAGSYVELQQAPRPEPAYAYVGGSTFGSTAVPPRGRLALTALSGPRGDTRWLGQLRAGPLFVTIWASWPLVLAAARGLEPRWRGR